MKKAGKTHISYKDFLDILRPSFVAIDSLEDMDAIISRTHVILITDQGLPQNEEDQQDDEDLMPPLGEALPGEDEEMADAISTCGGSNEKNDPSSHKATCGVCVLQWFGLPLESPSNDSFSVAELNKFLAPFKLELIRCSHKNPGIDGKYLCHYENHFTGLRASEGYIQYFDNGKVEVWNVG
eukprot:s2000_g7.t1